MKSAKEQQFEELVKQYKRTIYSVCYMFSQCIAPPRRRPRVLAEAAAGEGLKRRTKGYEIVNMQ